MSLEKARKDVLMSYAHKLIILLIAVTGYGCVFYLANAKRDFDKNRKKTWTISQEGLAEVKEITRQAIEPAKAQTEAFDKLLKTPFDSREALTETLQYLAEAEVWRRYRANVAGDLKGMRDLSAKSSAEAKEEFARRSDLVTREEAYARTQAVGVRQQIQAVAGRFQSSDDPKYTTRWNRGMAAITDEKGHLYILYEIAWYASLLFAILATSYLFIILITALPITSGEGYWTSRINKLLERMPSMPLGGGGGGAKGAALLAAVLGGAAAAPPILATVPGGQAETQITDNRSKVEIRSQTRVTNRYELERDFPSIPNYDQKLRELHEAVGDVYQSAKGIQKRVDVVEDTLVRSHNSLTDRVTRVSTMADRLECRIGDVDIKLVATEEGVYETRQQTLFVDANHREMKSNLGKHDQESSSKLNDIGTGQDRVRATLGAGVSQAAVRDPRGFWGRTFGRTYFQVSEMTPSLVTARKDLSPTADADLDFLAAAIGDMTTKPMHRDDFENELRAQLKKVLELTIADAEQKGVQPPLSVSEVEMRVNAIVDAELPVLLQLTSVPRT